MLSIIDNPSLAEAGKKRMPWFRLNMPIVAQMNRQFAKEKPFKGMVIATCFHIEPKTAFWLEGFLDGGVEHLYVIGNLGTTKADTAAYLASLDRVTVLGKENDTYEEHKSYLDAVIKNKIDLFLDNGASLNLAYQENKPDWSPVGSTEETRSGRLLMEQACYDADYPIIVIDDSPLKQLLENFSGVGQSVVDGFMRTTSLLVGGKRVLVVGYGYCGSGVAAKFKGLGALTSVYDTNPVYQLKAKTDGHQVGTLEELISLADIIVTVTGHFDVITSEHIPLFKNGAILSNAGHYKFEIQCEKIKESAKEVFQVKDGIEQVCFGDEKVVYILQDANPLNLAGGDGNPIEIMDIGLGLQSASAKRIIDGAKGLQTGMQIVPDDISMLVSRLQLQA